MSAPRGNYTPAAAGPQGPAGTLTVGTVITGAPGSSAIVEDVGTPSAALLNFTLPRGSIGPDGTAATVAIGTTSTLGAGSPATVTNVGSPAAAVLNFGVPAGIQGNAGVQGNAGAAATIAVGTVTPLAAGATPTIVNAGSSSAATFNFGIPAGDIGPAGPTTIGTPNTISAVFGTAQQATNPAKPSFISAVINTVYSVTIAGTSADTVELRYGPVQATVANGTGGFGVPAFAASLTGITLTIGLGMVQRSQICAMVPAGYYWALRRITGTTATIVQATDQSLG